MIAGGRYKVEAGDTIWTIADELSQLGSKISPFDIIKYNLNVNPHCLGIGSVLVVPTASAGEKCLQAEARALTPF